MAEQNASQAPEQRRNPKSYVGIVVSDKMGKTIIVRTQRMVQHRLYKKYVRRDKKFYAHDETNDARIGDTVEIVELTRPLSRLKRFRLRRIVERAK